MRMVVGLGLIVSLLLAPSERRHAVGPSPSGTGGLPSGLFQKPLLEASDALAVSSPSVASADLSVELPAVGNATRADQTLVSLMDVFSGKSRINRPNCD